MKAKADRSAALVVPNAFNIRPPTAVTNFSLSTVRLDKDGEVHCGAAGIKTPPAAARRCPPLPTAFPVLMLLVLSRDNTGKSTRTHDLEIKNLSENILDHAPQ